MIERKKKLRLVQLTLLIFGILIIYTTYYNKNSNLDKKIISKKTEEKVKKQTTDKKLEKGDIFFNVKYSGLDLNGNRYILTSGEAYLDDFKPEIVYMKIVHATFYFKNNTVLNIWSDNGTYNNKKLKNPPKSMEELINTTDARIVIQDPRTSSPGLGLLTWMKALYGVNVKSEWIKLNKKIISVTKGWTDAYYNFFMAGEADIVLSYTTSPAAHIMFEENFDISAAIFTEGNYLSVEFAGILKSSQNKKIANNFLNFMISNDFQSVIPSTNIMYPVTNIELPKSFKKLKVPQVLQIEPEEINKNKEEWINEWLNAS